MATKFRVVLRNIKAQNLLIKDTKTKSSDPYLKGNFDNFKTFQTEVVPKNLNPEFKFETTFFYETRFPNRLHEKMFKIEVFDKDKYSSDDFMGSIEIDLHTLATGPVRHDILIREFGKPAGRLSFDLEMDLWDDVVVTLKDINCDLTGIESWLSHDTIDPYMKVFFDFQPDNFVKTTSCKNTLKPCWSDTKQLVFKAPARQIVKGSVTFTLLADKTMTKDPYLGEANLKIEPFINRTDELQKFKIELKKRDGSAWRQDQSYVEGFVFMKNLPWLAQMARGTHTEIGLFLSFE
ncbi:C2 domain-containing protein [Paraphysoderma sedebokerense]|nr:C2 domain-containing protein [Paraphysoderma sedebokerense]